MRRTIGGAPSDRQENGTNQMNLQTRRERVTYRLVFPARVEARQVQAWLHLACGLLRSIPFSLSGEPTMVIETRASTRGIVHLLLLPKAQAETIIAQLRAQIPGVRAEPDARLLQQEWDCVIELGLRTPFRPLAIGSPEAVSTGLLASMQSLRPGDGQLLQWVLSPAVQQRPPAERRRRYLTYQGVGLPMEPGSVDREEQRQRRARLSEPCVQGVVRIAARSSVPAVSTDLCIRLRSALASVRGPHNGFRATWSGAKGRKRRVAAGAGRMLYPALLPISEVAALLAWPIGNPIVAGLPQARARHVPPPASVGSEGAVFATANFPGAERPLAITAEDACKHVLAIGPNGVGKTTLLNNLVCQWAEQGAGIVVLESKGDLFKSALECIPASRKDDLIVLEVGDSRPVGFNILSHGNAHSAIDELNALVTNIYGDSGVYTPLLLYHGLHALAETPGCTFIDLPAMLTPQSPEEAAWRESVVTNLRNKEIRLFWQRYLNGDRREQDRIAAPVHNRIWQFTVRPEVRTILGQTFSSFTFEQVVRENKIVLIHLNGVRVGTRTASIMGALLLSALWNAARTTRGKHPTYLVADEFQDFLTLTGDAADLLAKSRSFRLSLTLAHQHLSQLPADLRSAVLSNARSKIVFQTTAEDARTFVREFGNQVDDNDFLHLGPYEVIARIATAGGVSPPVTGLTLPPRRPTGLADEIRELSRQRYGRSLEQIEAEIAARRSAHQRDNKRRPKLGETEVQS